MDQQCQQGGVGGGEVPQHYAQAPRKHGALKGCLIAIIAAGALAFLAVIGISLLLIATAVAAVAGPSYPAEDFPFQEVTVGGSPGEPKIVCIAVAGLISGGAMPGASSPVAYFSAQLKMAREDSEVRGVILYVDSPGGEITASDIMHREVMKFREGPAGRPVVACLMDLAASGGYYVSVAADRIIAHPTSVLGSIGVMMPLYDATGLLKKIGIRDETITTGPFKDIGSPFAEKTEEQRRKEHEMLQSLIAAMHERFISVVAEGRGMEPEQVRPLADGRIFTSQQALQYGLIDRVGYESDAVAAVKKLAGIREVHLVRYRRTVTLSDVMSFFAKGPNLTLDVSDSLWRAECEKPMFLWVPPSRRLEVEALP